MKAFHIVGPAPLCTNTFLLVTDAGHAVAIDPAADADAGAVQRLHEKLRRFRAGSEAMNAKAPVFQIF